MTRLLILLFLVLSFQIAKASSTSVIPKNRVISILTEWAENLRASTPLEASELRDKDLELEFVNRLIFQVERKYKETDTRKFFLETISDMAETDRMSVNQAFGGHSLFLETLHHALEELLEPRENPVLFIQNFTRFSSLQNPAEIEAFAETRSYFDGKIMAAADPLDSNEAAEIAEFKLQSDMTSELNLLLPPEQNLSQEFPTLNLESLEF